MPHPRLTLLLPCRDGFSVCRTVLPRCMRSGFESSDFLLSLCSVKSQRYAEKSLCPVVSPVSVCGGGPVPRRRILSLCRTRGAARTAHDRFDDLLPRRAVPFGPLRPSHRFQPAAGRAPAPRTGLHPGTHVAHGRCGFLPLPRGAAPARGRRTALCGACRRARGTGCGRAACGRSGFRTGSRCSLFWLRSASPTAITSWERKPPSRRRRATAGAFRRLSTPAPAATCTSKGSSPMA